MNKKQIERQLTLAELLMRQGFEVSIKNNVVRIIRAKVNQKETIK